MGFVFGLGAGPNHQADGPGDGGEGGHQLQRGDWSQGGELHQRLCEGESWCQDPQLTAAFLSHRRNPLTRSATSILEVDWGSGRKHRFTKKMEGQRERTSK